MKRRRLLIGGSLFLALSLCACNGPEDRSPPSLYAYYCARCHGMDGRGDAERDNPRLDLIDSEMVRNGERNLIRRRIAFGYGTMPGFVRKLSPEELDSLVEFTLRLQRGEPWTSSDSKRPTTSSTTSTSASPTR